MSKSKRKMNTIYRYSFLFEEYKKQLKEFIEERLSIL